MKKRRMSNSLSNYSDEGSDVSSVEKQMENNESSEMFSSEEQSHNHLIKENLSWADAMSKILKTNKPKRRKTIVLSRAKRANEVKTEIKEEELDFEIDGAEEKPNVKTEIDIATNDTAKEEDLIKKIKKKDWASKGHIKPSILEKEREKSLQKVATRGVVQLFNAVREHQKTLEKDLEEAGSVENKKDKVLKSLDKRAFLDVLMGQAKSQPVSNLVPKEIKEDLDNPTWSILRDDFMMSSKLKDWDKQDATDIKDEPEIII